MAEEQRARRVRRWWAVSEKRQIVLLTKEPGASVAEVARAHGVNANQLFQWRRAFERGELSEGSEALLPVTLSPAREANSGAVPGNGKADEVALACAASAGCAAEAVATHGAIHIEIADRALISIEHGADLKLVRTVLEILGR